MIKNKQAKRPQTADNSHMQMPYCATPDKKGLIFTPSVNKELESRPVHSSKSSRTKTDTSRFSNWSQTIKKAKSNSGTKTDLSRTQNISGVSTFYKSGNSIPPPPTLPEQTLEQTIVPSKMIFLYEQYLPLWRQSVSTWRYSSPSNRFSKDSRFKDPILQGSFVDKININTSTLRKRSTSQGFGKKTDIFPFKHLERAQITPAPNSHKIKRYLEERDQTLDKSNDTSMVGTSFQNNSKNQSPEKESVNGRKRSQSFNCTSYEQQRGEGMKPGKTFGLGFDTYEKTYLNHANKIIYSPFLQANNPPPGSYEISEKIGNQKRKTLFQKKLKMFNEIIHTWDVPPLTKYTLNESLVTNKRFSNTTFGVGKRIDLAKPLNNYPGPKYDYQSQFDQNYSKLHY